MVVGRGVPRDGVDPLISIEISPIEAVINMSELLQRVGARAYWISQRFAVLVINQYAETHDEGFELVAESPGLYRYLSVSPNADERELASLEGMLRLGIPVLWFVPAWWGSIILFAAPVPSLQHMAGSALFFAGALGWFLASQHTSETAVISAITVSGRGEGLQLYEALREIEDVEDELHDERHDHAGRLSNARVKLNGALLDRVLEENGRD